MTPPAIAARRTADYGLDAPGVVATLTGVGLVALAAGLVLRGPWVGLVWAGASLTLSGLLMVLSSRVGKLRARDRLLDRLALRGDETVLDVGCGHGLLLLGAAARLPRGRAIGVDLWSQTDQRANSRAATIANAVAEGVAERVEVLDGDMRALPLPDAAADAVVSSLAVHNVPDRDGRRTAMREIVRVLKPGGRVALMDIGHTAEYAEDLRAAGLEDVSVSLPSPLIFPPVRTVRGVKPAAAGNGG